MKEVYIVSAARSPIGSFLGSLSSMSAVQLGSKTLEAAIQRAAIDQALIRQVIVGQVLTSSLGQNPARQIALEAAKALPQNLSLETVAFGVNHVCGSGLQAVALACQGIALGHEDIVAAGGVESMSNAPHAALLRKGYKMGDAKFIDTMQYDGLTDAFSGKLMGVTAENIAKKYGISREDQDQFSLSSQQKAAKAQEEGRFAAEIVPITIADRKKSFTVDQDEFIRKDISMEALASLRPVFIEGGSVTAGNSSGINDGASFTLLASGDMLKQHNLKPLARIVSFASAGVDPDYMGTGPIPAIKDALKRAGWSLTDADLIECNEAFAAQALCVMRELEIDPSKCNVNGGAIALGHPIGASGNRVLVTLVHELLRQRKKKGIAALCIGGGMGIAMCIETMI